MQVTQNKKNYIASIVLFLYAAVALSSWSYYILCNVIGLPFYVYEVFFIPFLYIYRNNIKQVCSRVSVKYMTVALLMIICFCVGAVRNSQYLIEHITTFRTLVYIFVFMLIFSQTRVFNLFKLQIMCTGGIVGQFFYIMTIGVLDDQTAVNIVALALMVAIPFVKERIIESIIFSMFGLIVSFRSAFRINIVVVLVVMIIGFIYLMFVKKRTKAIFAFLSIIVVGTITISNIDAVVDYLVDILRIENAYSIFRITDRLQALFSLNFEASQDTIRFELISKGFTEFFDTIIPTGMIGKATGQYGLYKDAPVTFLYAAFGSIISMFFILLFMIKGAKFSIHAVKKKNKIVVFAIMYPILILLFVLNGTFLMATYDACITGIIMGYWFNKNSINEL